MKLKAWLDEFNGAPLDLEEVAGTAIRVTDDAELKAKAEAYLMAKFNLESQLKRVGFEPG